MTTPSGNPNSNPGQGFDPNRTSARPSPAQTGPNTSTGLGDNAAKTLVSREMAMFLQNVDQALSEQVSGICEAQTHYEREATAVRQQASVILYDMLSGKSLFEGITADALAMLEEHPTAPKHELGKQQLKPISLDSSRPTKLKPLSIGSGVSGGAK